MRVILAVLLSLLVSYVAAQTATRMYTQPFEGPSDQDPSLTSLQGLCSLASIRASETGSPRPIGPLTIGTECFSSGTLPSSGIATIFSEPTSSAATSSSSSTTSSTTSSSTSTMMSSSSTPTPSQTSAGSGSQTNAAPRTPNWIARQNITLLLVSTFCLLAAVTYFLDELLELLV